MQIYGENSYQPDEDKNKDKLRYKLTTLNCIILFLVGFLGIEVISFLVNLILIYTPIWEVTEEGVSSVSNTFYVNFFTYIIITPIMVWLLWYFDKDGFKRNLKNFGDGHIWLSGLIFFFILSIASYAYNYLEYYIELALNITTSTNGNQSTIQALLLAFPIPMLFETCILAPITEEIAYRQGLFECIRRKSRFWAYFAVCFVFGLIHVSSSLLSFIGQSGITSSMIWSEILAFPTYAIGGGVLARCYEKNNSVSASIITHMIVNFVSCISIFITVSAASSSSSGLIASWISQI